MPIKTLFPGSYTSLDFMPFLRRPQKLKIGVLLHVARYPLQYVLQE